MLRLKSATLPRPQIVEMRNKAGNTTLELAKSEIRSQKKMLKSCKIFPHANAIYCITN